MANAQQERHQQSRGAHGADDDRGPSIRDRIFGHGPGHPNGDRRPGDHQIVILDVGKGDPERDNDEPGQQENSILTDPGAAIFPSLENRPQRGGKQK